MPRPRIAVVTDAPSPQPSEQLPPPPVTGNHEIDRALAGLDLSADPAEHPEQIAAALDVVQRVLAGPSVPQALRPS